MFALSVLMGTALAVHPQSSEVASARSLLRAGNLEQAETVLRQVINAHGDSADAHFLLGYVLFRKHQATESLAEFTAGARYREPGADDLKVVASDYVLLHAYSDADKWFTRALAEKPDDAQGWYLLGRTKYNESDFAAAIDSFQRAVALQPKFVEAENNIGLCWKELGDATKARGAFESAIAWQGASPQDAQPFLNLGTLLGESSHASEALQYLVKAAELSPRNPAAHEKLAKVYLNAQKLPEAQHELEQAVSLAPDVASLHFQLGQVDRKLGQSARAEEQFAICKRLSSTHSSANTPNVFEPEDSKQ